MSTYAILVTGQRAKHGLKRSVFVSLLLII